MSQRPLVLLRAKAGDAISRHLDRVVAVAQSRYGVQHANIGAVAHHYDLIRRQSGELIGEVSLKKTDVTVLLDYLRLPC